MRRIIFFIISVILLTDYANGAIVQQLATKLNDSQCSGALVNRQYYISGDSIDDYLIDEIWSPTDRYIAISTSQISFWESENNLVTGCRTSSDWYRQSEVAPGNNTRVVAFGANCTFNKPTNLNNRTLQFVYNIKHGEITTNGNSTYTKNYSTYNHNTRIWSTFTKDYQNYLVGEYIIHSSECFNVELMYCGDNIISNGEQCDDGNNIDGDGCSATCKQEICISGGVSGLQTSPVTSTTPNLCNAGEIVGNFLSIVNTTNPLRTDYTWTCNGISGGNCNAYYISTTPICNSGGVSGLQTSPVTSTTPNLCNAGETVGNFLSTVNTTNPLRTDYTWTCNGISGGDCNAYYISPTSESCTSGGVTGNVSQPITTATPGLCMAGSVLSNFSAIPDGDSTDYTWSCDGLTGGTCHAKHVPPGRTPCTTGGVSGNQPSPITISTLDLCRAGEIPSNLLSDVIGNRTNYSWQCNGKTGGSCYAYYITGGGGSSCVTGGVSGNQPSPITISTQGLCRAGEIPSNLLTDVIGNRTNYSWQCNGKTGGSCYASYSSGGGGGSGNYCGDGIIQRPNDQGLNEECDVGSESVSYCINCEYNNYTVPNGGEMSCGPNDSVIIGTGMNPYIAHSLSKPYIYNNSDYDLYFDKLCVFQQGIALYGNNICEHLGTVPKKTKVSFSHTPDFKGRTITTGNIGDSKLITTINHNKYLYDDAYFIGTLDVRVAKSSIATIGGGTSYVSDTSKVSNISDVARKEGLSTDPDKNKNFVGVGVSTGSVSSYSNDIDDNESVGTISSVGDDYSDSIEQVSDTSGTANGSTSNLSSFENYNGIENVFILRNENFVITSNIFSGISRARTYIIENGDLEINANILYSDNIAFVVKGGDIKINKAVTRIDGTYITILKEGEGGQFLGTGDNTLNILEVNGSLYGNINYLISSRTYVKQNGSNQIDVGTIVSFGSSLFRKTAPLVSTFINEYLRSEKVAR